MSVTDSRPESIASFSEKSSLDSDFPRTHSEQFTDELNTTEPPPVQNNLPEHTTVEQPPTVLTPTVLRRKLASFVGFSNLPQQWHQKSMMEGFDFNLLVVGESGLGKSTLLNTLFQCAVHDLDAPHTYENGDIRIQDTRVELEESQVKLRLNVIDTPGFGDNINNLESWKVIIDEIESRFNQYLEAEESISSNSPSTKHDTRIHACLYFIEPNGHTMKPLDVVAMKKLYRKVNLIPVIAKADTLSEEELAVFKKSVLAELEMQGITFFTPPTYEDDDEESAVEVKELQASFPFAVVGSTNTVINKEGHEVLGREYPWGIVEVHNESHNDFVKLRNLLIRNHMEDLRDKTKELYETYRQEKLTALGVKQDDSVFSIPDPALRQEEERRNHEARLAKMEAEMRSVFEKKVTEKEAKLKTSEAELFQKHRELKEQLEQQRLELEQRKAQLQQQIQLEQERRTRRAHR